MYAIDEVHLLEGDVISHLWGKMKERLKIPIENSKNRQTYYGAMDLANSELMIQDDRSGNGEYTVDFLKKLLKKNSDPNHPEKSQKIIIFWDGASDHKGEKMQELLAELNKGLAPEYWKITCHLFAPYAPEKNPIEAIWLSLKSLLRRCYRFCKKFRIMKKMFEFFVEYNLFDFPDMKKYDAFSGLI